MAYPLNVKSISCSLGKKVVGHGLVISIDLFPNTKGLPDVKNVRLDLTGNVFKAMPPGTDVVARWLLPVRVRDLKDDVAAVVQRTNTLTFTLGVRKLSHKTLIERLTALQQKGDPMFVIDLVATRVDTGDDVVFARCFTKASHMLNSLSAPNRNSKININIRVYGDETHLVDNLRKQANAKIVNGRISLALKFLRWWLLALVYAAIAWGVLVSPGSTVDRVPSHVRLVWFHSEVAHVSVAGALPALSESRSQAFQLGMLWAQIRASQNNTASSSKLLTQATSLLTPAVKKLGLSPTSNLSLTMADLDTMLTRIIEEEQHVGVAGRVLSAFSLINFVWFLSIVGIMVSIGPSLWVFLKPFRELLVRFAKRVFEFVIEPVLTFCHNWGIFELLLWGVSYMMMVDAYRFYGLDAGLYVTLTSLGIACLGLIYSQGLHSKPFANMDGRPDLLYARYSVIALTPLAVVYHSNVLAFATVAAMYYVLGFSFFCVGLCWCIGFENKMALERCAAASALCLFLLVAMHLNLEPGSFVDTIVDPFRVPLSVFGSIVLDIALLIMSHPTEQKWRIANAMMVSSLLFQMFVGEALALTGMYNTAWVMLFFYATMQYSYFHRTIVRWNVWVLVLVISLTVWRAALWLHTHPGFVVDCFTKGA
eukprot:m.191558 g.191558  ORF g.191558 m.191558 type:complete len:650 (-) comp32436_c0_seq1:130-2079(-)